MTSSPTDPVSSALLHLAAGLRQAADQLGLPRLGAQVLEETTRRLTESRLRVLVLGEIKQGKSTLINAILGEALLPTGVTPTTGAVVQLVRGDATERRLHGAAGSEVLAPERFAELARGKSPIEGSLVVTTTSEQLPPELELIDTPGINDILRLRTLISRGELPRGDALLLVLDATQVLKRTELAFLRDALIAVGGLGDSGATLLLALNRVDLIPEAERPAVLSHIEAQLASMIPGPLEDLPDRRAHRRQRPDQGHPRRARGAAPARAPQAARRPDPRPVAAARPHLLAAQRRPARPPRRHPGPRPAARARGRARRARGRAQGLHRAAARR
ncbi:dynamin family protein [Nannocystis pusilla]|uniref:dynamin family protein n=1 Tax=Nannocystis pusilla TaxID=889268 RepID=UPI003DA39988